MTQTFPCSACGAPNEAEANTVHMACTYCGANVTIPENLRIKREPKVEKSFSKARPVSSPEIDAPDLLRKAQPIAIRAWNLYAAWTWLRWLLPTCFVLLIVGIIICVILGVFPFILNRF
jgi:DNA-directed RNA polymerase subunit RPC12/RpoP